MKKISGFLVLSFLISIMSCSKDCTPPAIEENVVGTWSGSIIINGSTKQGGEASFNSDHSGTSPGEVLQASFNGGPKIKDFTWQVDTVDNTLDVTYDDNGSIFTIHYQIASNKCNSINLELLGGTLSLIRK